MGDVSIGLTAAISTISVGSSSWVRSFEHGSCPGSLMVAHSDGFGRIDSRIGHVVSKMHTGQRASCVRSPGSDSHLLFIGVDRSVFAYDSRMFKDGIANPTAISSRSFPALVLSLDCMLL